MDYEILFEGPGYTIARSYKAETLVPYFDAERENGERNHGWFDLRGHPERVCFVPEALRNKGLENLLLVMAHPSSKVMSSACDCGSFNNGADHNGPRFTAGGFVTCMFLDAEKNTKPEELIELARYVLGGIKPTTDHHISYEMFIEPLKTFFGKSDCFALTIHPMGHGETDHKAWSAFECAATIAANSLQRGRPTQDKIDFGVDKN